MSPLNHVSRHEIMFWLKSQHQANFDQNPNLKHLMNCSLLNLSWCKHQTWLLMEIISWSSWVIRGSWDVKDHTKPWLVNHLNSLVQNPNLWTKQARYIFVFSRGQKNIKITIVCDLDAMKMMKIRWNLRDKN